MNKEQLEKLNEELKQLEEDYIECNRQPLYEFADLVPEDTNLKEVVWVDGPRNMKHGKRIKFQNNTANKLNGGELIPMTISDEPKIPDSVKTKLKIKGRELERIKKWVILNKEVLEKYAEGKITTKQLYLEIQPLED